uniref:Putative secreted protein n=1 Tax=Amblyomma cajennense TaxID=34607 RepID=A0A023FDQ4_AMBCJ
MRAMVACLALFLAVAVLHCDGKRKKRDADSGRGGCDYGDKHVKEGVTRNLTEPCEQVTCTRGELTILTCASFKEKVGELRGKDKKEGKGRKERKTTKETEKT